MFERTCVSPSAPPFQQRHFPSFRGSDETPDSIGPTLTLPRTTTDDSFHSVTRTNSTLPRYNHAACSLSFLTLVLYPLSFSINRSYISPSRLLCCSWSVSIFLLRYLNSMLSVYRATRTQEQHASRKRSHRFLTWPTRCTARGERSRCNVILLRNSRFLWTSMDTFRPWEVKIPIVRNIIL